MEKTEAKLLQEKLFYKKKNAGLILSDEQVRECDDFCENYKKFLDSSKTEREAVDFAVNLIKKEGFVEFSSKQSLKPGDKVYLNNRGKALIFAVIGTEDVKNGVRIAAAHIDSPRLDLKQCPLYEDNELALFKTHYYGGI
ncbi:MAG TPA: aminopeptidase, partial [Oscillospiraceae bacterium]|nr:aminopeptidase [Oscillospiraceae bacterium]